jgi:hypothetical protein
MSDEETYTEDYDEEKKQRDDEYEEEPDYQEFVQEFKDTQTGGLPNKKTGNLFMAFDTKNTPEERTKAILALANQEFSTGQSLDQLYDLLQRVIHPQYRNPIAFVMGLAIVEQISDNYIDPKTKSTISRKVNTINTKSIAHVLSKMKNFQIEVSSADVIRYARYYMMNLSALGWK